MLGLCTTGSIRVINGEITARLPTWCGPMVYMMSILIFAIVLLSYSYFSSSSDAGTHKPEDHMHKSSRLSTFAIPFGTRPTILDENVHVGRKDISLGASQCLGFKVSNQKKRMVGMI